jgi:hypothetical protein
MCAFDEVLLGVIPLIPLDEVGVGETPESGLAVLWWNLGE